MPDHRDALRAMTPWLVIIALVAVFDQVTKVWVLAYFKHSGRLEVTSFFDLVLAFNTGAAFSFLAEHSGWQRWFFAALALIVSIWLLVLMWQHRHERLLPSAFALIIGGALGNVIDRFIHGAVVDFLSFHAGQYYWPAFNLADSAITLGASLMIVGQFRTKKNLDIPPESPT
ncbi:MAG: signal peptidase II [Betaproteobacteria bacterium]|nr:signal peptidase II [Betaproteobacteria bacterium]